VATFVLVGVNRGPDNIAEDTVFSGHIAAAILAMQLGIPLDRPSASEQSFRERGSLRGKPPGPGARSLRPLQARLAVGCCHQCQTSPDPEPEALPGIQITRQGFSR